jgi:hypothetical protein
MHLALPIGNRNQRSLDKREYLRGICVEVSPDEVRLVATSGSVMGQYRVPGGRYPVRGVDEVTSFIIPLAAVKALKKPVTKAERIRRHSRVFIYKDEAGRYRMVDGDNRYDFEPVPGTYPDFRRVWPEKCSGIPAQLDPKLLGLFALAAEELDCKSTKVLVAHNGPNSTPPCVVTIRDDGQFSGLIAGVNVKPESLVPAAWTTETYSDRQLARFLHINERMEITTHATADTAAHA